MRQKYYSKDGTRVNLRTGFEDLISYECKRDSTTGACYYVVKVPQTDEYGNKQYPFTTWPNCPNGGIQSTLQMNRERKFLVATNGGGCYTPYDTAPTGLPIGPVIENGVVLWDPFKSWVPDMTEVPNRIMTIDGNGTLGYVRLDVTAEEMVSNGIVSCNYGWYPLIVNYRNFDEIDEGVANHMNGTEAAQDAQRQAICQYENGDYLIISAEGRNNRGGGFFTVRQMQTLCRQYGVKFAWLLDGGGSVETVIGDKQINNIYVGTYGRPIPTYIVFNGTTQFKASNA